MALTVHTEESKVSQEATVRDLKIKVIEEYETEAMGILLKFHWQELRDICTLAYYRLGNEKTVGVEFQEKEPAR